MRISGAVAVAGAFALVIGHAAAASAQPFDHLKCYKVKELTKLKVKGLVDLTPRQSEFLVEKDCKIVGPKLLCVPVRKENVRTEPPPDPDAVAGPLEIDHICYALKCRKPFPPAVKVIDQFGTFELQPKGTSLLCTPARKAGQTTTTVTTSTTSTTMPQEPCRDLAATGAPPMCGGTCPLAIEACLFVGGGCDCVPVDDGCSLGTSGQCSGLCPNATDMCVPGVLDACECMPRCEAGAAPACGGFCPQDTLCVSDAAGQQCICLPVS
jgi:hypothetical protein